MKSLDRAFCGLLLLGSLLHAGGSVAHYQIGAPELVWALSGSLAGGLTAAINLIRCERPDDFPVAWVSLAASLGWFAVAIGFGASIGNLLDPRALWHAICALALAIFSLRTGLAAGVDPNSLRKTPPHHRAKAVEVDQL